MFSPAERNQLRALLVNGERSADAIVAALDVAADLALARVLRKGTTPVELPDGEQFANIKDTDIQ